MACAVQRVVEEIWNEQIPLPRLLAGGGEAGSKLQKRNCRQHGSLHTLLQAWHAAVI